MTPANPKTANLHAVAPQTVQFYDLARQRARIEPELKAGLEAVLSHGQFILGPEVETIEEELASYADVKHGIGISSGRDALIMALMALEIGPGDAVFVPAFTFSATAGSVASVGAVPVFVDVDGATFNMCPDDLAHRIAETRSAGKVVPRAVMPVDLFGLPANYSAISELAAREDIVVIADAAQSLGGIAPQGRVGSLAPITAVSFYPTKPLGAYGDGGAILSSRDDLAESVRQIRTHGRQGSGDEALRLGMTGRLDTLQAAVLLAKMKVFDDELKARQQIAERYTQSLGNFAITPHIPEGYQSAWALYTLRVPRRDEVREALSARGVATGLFYKIPLHHHAAFAPWVDANATFPVSEKVADEVLSLPIHPDLTDAEIDHVIASVQAVLS